MVVEGKKPLEAKMERCVCCGAELPYEGTLVCWKCSRECPKAAAQRELWGTADGQKRWKQQRAARSRAEMDGI